MPIATRTLTLLEKSTTPRLGDSCRLPDWALPPILGNAFASQMGRIVNMFFDHRMNSWDTLDMHFLLLSCLVHDKWWDQIWNYGDAFELTVVPIKKFGGAGLQLWRADFTLQALHLKSKSYIKSKCHAQVAALSAKPKPHTLRNFIMLIVSVNYLESLNLDLDALWFCLECVLTTQQIREFTVCNCTLARFHLSRSCSRVKQ